MKIEPGKLITQITRREWLLRLGQGVTLAGISGIIPESPLHRFAADSSALPPGLYEPSADDLVHALSHHSTSAPPVGSETDYVRPDVAYQLQFFSAEDFRTIQSFVAILLGDLPSNTLHEVANWVDLWFYSAQGVREAARSLDPLHRALAVAYFGEPAVSEVEAGDPAKVAAQGLIALNKFCVDENGKPFAMLDVPEQLEIVRSISTDTEPSPRRDFFELLRNQAIRGYYTSADGLKELDYQGNAYYPFCPGCESAPKG